MIMLIHLLFGAKKMSAIPEIKSKLPFSNKSTKQKSTDSLSHELRTSLHGILGSLEILKELPLHLQKLRKSVFIPPSLLVTKLNFHANFLKTYLLDIQKNKEQLQILIIREDNSLGALSKKMMKHLDDFQRSILVFLNNEQALSKLAHEMLPLNPKDWKQQLKVITKALSMHLDQALEEIKGLYHTTGYSFTDVPPPEKKAKTSKVLLSSIKILIVDDNVINQKILIHFLKKKGYAFAVANNGAEAVEKFSAEKFDMVLMDIQMPVMDGLEATRAIRQLEKEESRVSTPIAALTAITPTVENQNEVYAAGMNDFLSKPFNSIQIDHLLKKHRVQEVSSPSSSPSSEALKFSLKPKDRHAPLPVDTPYLCRALGVPVCNNSKENPIPASNIMNAPVRSEALKSAPSPSFSLPPLLVVKSPSSVSDCPNSAKP